MADIKRFLDQGGVSVLWGEIAKNINAEAERAKEAENTIAAAAKQAQDEIDALEVLVGTLPESTDAKTVVEYINKKTEGIATDAALGELQNQVTANKNALETLNGNENVVGSVANIAKAAAVDEVASIVNENNNGSIDTLNEIAAWIINDTTGAASMANDIAALEALVGDTAVATQISNALKIEGVDKYALAADLATLDSNLTGRITALEEAGHVTQDAIDTGVQSAKDYADSLAKNYDAAGTAETKANAAETNAKAYAQGLDTAMDTRVKVLEAIDHTKFESAGAAAGALTDAKAYTDAEVAKIQALTKDEVLAAINTANAQ